MQNGLTDGFIQEGEEQGLAVWKITVKVHSENYNLKSY